MKKILIYSLAYFPFVGGAEVALREVVKRLKNSYKFEIVTARMKCLRSVEYIDGIKVRRIGIGIQFIDKLLFIPLGILYGLFHRHDIVFGLLENQSALISRAVSNIKGSKCIINLQSGDTEDYMRKKLGIFYFLYSWVYGRKATYVVLSKYLKDRALNHGVPEKNIVVIPNGVDLASFSCKSIKRTEKKKNIVTASRLVLKNAVDDIIKAFAIVNKKIPDSKLTVCGTGEDDSKLRNLAVDLKIADKVDFVGLVSHNELPKILCNSDVFVRPSISEGFGNSFIEALACGVPIVGTEVGGIPDFLVDGKTGLFCKVRNPEDLADKIFILLKDKKLSDRIVKNGQLMIRKKYEWDIIARQFKEVFG